MTEETKQKIQRIAQHYGYDSQSRQCIEEMAELTQAINKFWRKQLKCGGGGVFKIYPNFYRTHELERRNCRRLYHAPSGDVYAWN